jgi:NifU-like protein involved in Fe-S cluster formation
MTESVKGHPVTDASALAGGFKDLMSGTGSTEGLAGNEDLEALQGVKKFPVRVKCALLPWTALLEIIDRWESAPEHSAEDREVRPVTRPRRISRHALRTACGSEGDSPGSSR